MTVCESTQATGRKWDDSVSPGLENGSRLTLTQLYIYDVDELLNMAIDNPYSRPAFSCSDHMF